MLCIHSAFLTHMRTVHPTASRITCNEEIRITPVTLLACPQLEVLRHDFGITQEMNILVLHGFSFPLSVLFIVVLNYSGTVDSHTPTIHIRTI
eukprot:gene3891-2761_t